MDLIIQTSLEALLLKATNPQNQNVDTAAVEAFCTLVNKEKDGAHIGVKVLASKLPTGNEREMLQILHILDTCMSRCGSTFQSEVGKFRFLNEMIKLVSPKYLGTHTPITVRQKVLQILYLWTLDYPKETKIRDAYDMLRKQGVITEIPNPNIINGSGNSSSSSSSCCNNNSIKKRPNSVFYDEEKSKILQKLLQSKDPEDIQAANWLIKSMVKEDDKKTETKHRQICELESIQNNVRLLNEMLESYRPGVSSVDELELIKDLHQCCERLRPNIMKLASEVEHNEEMLANVLASHDELSQVFIKYNQVIIKGIVKRKNKPVPVLLDFDNAIEGASNCHLINNNTKDTESQIDYLCDIFNSTNIPDTANVLQPITIVKNDVLEDGNKKEENTSKLKALEELDVLSENLLKENLQSIIRQGTFNRIQNKTPLNLLSKINEIKQTMKLNNNNETKKPDQLNFDYLLNKSNDDDDEGKKSKNSDDSLVDLNDEKLLESDDTTDNKVTTIGTTTAAPTTTTTTTKTTTADTTNKLKLNDIIVKLDTIKPSTVSPIEILNDKNNVTITIHLARDKPKIDVNCYVITTINRNELPLNNYLFQAIVSNGFKLKLQSSSNNELPSYNPFLPPTAITQIMLIAKIDNNIDNNISLKFIVSYCMDDETYTEMGEVNQLPYD